MVHLILFITTCITTTIAGIIWISGPSYSIDLDVLKTGLPYSVSIIFILGSHEFGHYFAAKYHKVPVTLPYFIPFPSFPFFINFGTMGAVIRTKAVIPNNKAMFDIGVYGPIAGFIASLMVLIYGFTHLPGTDYITAIHPEYFSNEFASGNITLRFGDSLLYAGLQYMFTSPEQFVPPMTEIYHYPYLCAGWFGLFITAMNMIPVGQLDGGHIIYSMLGDDKHQKIAKLSLMFVIVLGLLGPLSMYWRPDKPLGWLGWLLWAGILKFAIKISHPPVLQFEELDRKRKCIGYFSLFILIVSFSPSPFIVFI